MIIRNWMQQNPNVINGDMLLTEAKQILTDENLQALPVLDEGRLRGMITRQHCLRAAHFVARTQNPDEYSFYANRLKVKDVMLRNPATMKADDTIEECLRRGQELGIGQFPVLDGDKVVGVISSKEILALAARFLGAWERRSGVTLGQVELKAGTLSHIAQTADAAGADVHAIYPIAAEGNGNGDSKQRKVIVRFNAADTKKVVTALQGAGYKVIEFVEATRKPN